MNSWLNSTDLCRPAVSRAAAGHGVYCPVDCPCRTQRDSELQKLRDKMQLIVHTSGIKNFSKTHTRSEGASSVGEETEPSEEATGIFSIAPSSDNGNPRRWLLFQREFKLWVKTQKLHEDQFLAALSDCLEGPPANTLLRTWSDCEETSSPVTFDEVWEHLEVRGSRLPEDHYHQMLKNLPSFSRLILHEALG